MIYRSVILKLIFIFNLIVSESCSASSYDSSGCSCGDSIRFLSSPSSRGVILSPGYPELYHCIVNCTWVLNGFDGYTIKITFPEFYTKASTLIIYNGLLSDDSVSSSCSGNTCPDDISSGSRMTVQLVNYTSDDLPSQKDPSRFIAIWHVESSTSPTDKCSCGDETRYLSTPFERGVVVSPVQCSMLSATCAWQLYTFDNYLVRLTLKNVRGCSLTVFDGNENSGPKLLSCSGSNCTDGTTVTSTGPWLTVKFSSDVQDRNLFALWVAVPASQNNYSHLEKLLTNVVGKNLLHGETDG